MVRFQIYVFPHQIISLVEKDIAIEDLQDYSGNEDVVSSGSLSEDTGMFHICVKTLPVRL